ncbi:hypothetical protein BHE90_010241 [Fusarium euwallaceae]|uniref:Protein kinase domain-containing protein n=1 Tax=Fusarium euwallaceae TaxID=1147111 RepID=A0A430LHT3_9HYPO|nr:hypothetical protein BHE90_010241 [Fusarium euwallaceae]
MDADDISVATVPPLVGSGSGSTASGQLEEATAFLQQKATDFLQYKKVAFLLQLGGWSTEKAHSLLGIQTRDDAEFLPLPSQLELERKYLAKSPEMELSSGLKSYRRIHAVLIQLERGDAIRHFMEAGIDDDHLPFRILQSRPDGTLQVQSERKPGKIFNHFFGLGQRKAAMFMERQWSLPVPSLFDHHMVPRNALPLALDPETILPFTNAELFNSGAYGKVYRVRIHEDCLPDQAGFASSATQRPEYLAIKKLHSNDETAFCREVAVLRELNEFAHPHIVPLLLSFKLDDEPHLVFPWADCDLSMFWRLNPNPEHSFATTWCMLKQLTGLADGLSLLHGFEKGKKERRWHGRHGDLKPSNILVFSWPSDTITDSMDKYVLSLCDFGLSSLQKQGAADTTRSDREVSHKHTPVYRAPEFDLEPRIVGESADIWSLGCVFLEAASWLVTGGNGLKCLAYCREDLDPSASSHGAFFSMSAVTDGDRDTQATLKAQVCDWMTLLRHHPHSSDFIDDLLDLITQQMLVVESRHPPRQRSSSQEVCEALVRLLKKLEADENYASPRCVNCVYPPQSCTGQSEDNQCPTHGTLLKMAPSKRDRGGKRKQKETYAPDDKEKSAASAQPQRMFACPFCKAGMPMGRACKGPGWTSAHRVKEHLLRPHTPKSFRDPSGCPRCLEGFKTKELLAQHLRQEPQCLIKAPEIIAGQLTLEQAANLRSTRKKSDMSEEDRWFEIYHILFPDHDLSTMNLTPYHEEMTVSSIDTLSTQSSTGIAEFRNYIEQEHKQKKQKKEAEFRDMGIDPEMSKTLAAKFFEDQLKSLQEFDDNKLKLTYNIGVGGSDPKVDATPDGLVDPAEGLDHYVDPYYVPEWAPEGTGDNQLSFLLPLDS